MSRKTDGIDADYPPCCTIKIAGPGRTFDGVVDLVSLALAELGCEVRVTNEFPIDGDYMEWFARIDHPIIINLKVEHLPWSG